MIADPPRSRQMLRRAASVRQDEAGFVLVFFAICIPALLGLVGLAVDGARLLILDTQAAAIADAAALAAANRLDRSAGAIAAARGAALALDNRVTLADLGGGRRLSLRFAANLSDLKAGATNPLAETAGASAVYAEATTSEVSLDASLLALLGGRPARVRRRAIAESQYYACDVTPAVLCQPDPDAFAATARPGRQYLLRMDGNRVAGSIALLDRPDRVGTRQSLQDLAGDRPQFCYGDGVALRTNVAPAEYDDALNIRFDRYFGRAGPVAPDLAVYPPAPIVVQGRRYETCASPINGYSTAPPFALPRDSAFQGLKLSAPWDQGAGDWRTAGPVGSLGARSALDEYVLWNHDNKSPDLQARLRESPTRWDLYLRELGLDRSSEGKPVDTRSYGSATATIPTGGPASSPLRERAAPICYAGTLPPTQVRRRILYLSIADCTAFPNAATAANLSRRVAKVFVTEPSDLGATLVEFVGLLTPAEDDGKLRHVVQLVETD
ncbi:pilus assembly protein TadG-related protein [Methylobacterium sp. J-059]|uniref:TadE/TadG family type IV pilus assembly protein n=1 Tax=Methylobacterium sp. J-059 TaxID=2836643 RepID=UPI001FBBBA28|nr:pilus assembly protein TadG-related protein [Methylobacterium sp. J-059]MCJ2039288.1 pilus assembly protein TadG-related protein [Methylobacterium sp. J-059]